VASLSQGRTAAAQCGLFTYKSVPVIFEPPCIIRGIKSKRLKWMGNVASLGERRGAYKVLVGKPEGKRLLDRSRLS